MTRTHAQTETTPLWLMMVQPDEGTTDRERALMHELMMALQAIRGALLALNIPDQPAEVDDLYYAMRAGTLEGRMKMAINALETRGMPA